MGLRSQPGRPGRPLLPIRRMRARCCVAHADFRKEVISSMSPLVLETISNEFVAAAEAVGPSVVAIYARRWMPASGVVWKPGVIVTADHNLRREEEIVVVGHDGKRIPAKLAGRDPSTDLAILKLDDAKALPTAPLADDAALRLGHLVLALGRSRGTNVVASFGMIGAASGEWRTWRGGKNQQNHRTHPN